MRRLSTIIADLEHATADLEMLASVEEDRDGFQPSRAYRVGQLRAQAGALAQVVSHLHGL